MARFPARAAGPADRLAGFLAHLRLNGLRPDPAEALAGLAAIDATDEATARLALRALCAATPADWQRFDALFDAYWRHADRVREGPPKPRTKPLPRLWSEGDGGAAGTPDAPEPGEPTDAEGRGRLVASRRETLSRRDLRELATDAELRAAERIAERLARAIRQRHARRRRAAIRGPEIDLRRTLRRAPGRGGEPIDLLRRRRRTPPLRLVALLDVSGSMALHARVFLAFLRGLAGAEARAFLFHTRLVEVTDALTDSDGLRAASRLSLVAEGFGSGTRIASCLASFRRQYRRAVTRRTAVLVLSDGYDTDPPAALAAELARLRARARRLIWLTPLRGAPASAAMAAARPHLDALLPAHSLADLAALEAELARL